MTNRSGAAVSQADLDVRTGLPTELRLLVERYPRDTWHAHRNLGQMARFWLARHDMFREIGERLDSALHEVREGRLGGDAFRREFVPSLGFFLNQLNEHHYIEDQHYFPVFRTADQRLAAGFDILDRDHETIHADLLATAEAANRLIRAIAERQQAVRGADAEAAARETDAYAAASDQLIRRMLRHLDDEEDLIIPLILDRGEGELGVG